MTPLVVQLECYGEAAEVWAPPPPAELGSLTAQKEPGADQRSPCLQIRWPPVRRGQQAYAAKALV